MNFHKKYKYININVNTGFIKFILIFTKTNMLKIIDYVFFVLLTLPSFPPVTINNPSLEYPILDITPLCVCCFKI